MDKLFRQSEFADIYRCLPNSNECNILSNAFASIAGEYELSLAGNSEKAGITNILSNFDSLKGHETEHIINVLKVKKSNLFFSLIIVGLDFSAQRGSKSLSKEFEYEMLALVHLNKDLGKVYISPESIPDKISEFFNPVEIDFPDDKAFSDKYYVLSADAAKVRENLNANLRKAITGYNNLYLECSGEKIIIRMQNEISMENAKTISHAGFSILESQK
jgi:hypothetical protein